MKLLSTRNRGEGESEWGGAWCRERGWGEVGGTGKGDIQIQYKREEKENTFVYISQVT